MKKAIIDIGSNTIRMEIFEDKTKLFSKKETAGLIGYVKKEIMTKQGEEILYNTLANFKQVCISMEINSIHPFATASLRPVKNADQIVKNIDERLGLQIRILTGEEEAVLDFESLMNNFETAENGIMVDAGGGSTEIVRFENRMPISKICVPIGSLALFETEVEGVLPKKKELEKIRGIVKENMRKAQWLKNVNGQGYAIGGTARTFAKVHREMHGAGNEPINGYTFNRKDLDDIYDQRKKFRDILLKTSPDRIHTFFPGCVILSYALRNVDIVSVSELGVRDGFLDLLEENE